MPKIVFMGTPEFAVPSLKALIGAGFNIPLVISQPDRKKGRGHKIQHTPTKEVALENGIEVFQPDSIRSSAAIEKLRAIEAGFFVVIAYGKILPEEVLNLPRKACINVHASLLPMLRGAAPIQFSLLNGDEETGVCSMLMDKGMDTGDILQIKKTGINPDENCGQLTGRLSELGAELIVDTIHRFDELTPMKQNHEKATYTRLLNKDDRFIDWGKKAHSIYCQFRALSPFPGVVTSFRGKRLMIKGMGNLEHIVTGNSPHPGEIINLNEFGFDVACGEGSIRILSCQPESKKQVSALEFINGHQLKTGEILGDSN